MRAWAAPFVLALSACGGASPLLYPAKPLPRGDVRALAGFSGQFASGSLSTSLSAARSDATGDTQTEGALVAAALAPALSPVLGARTGLGAGVEGGLAYQGRGVHADVRRGTLLGERLWLSLGLGGTYALVGRSETSTPTPLRDISLRGLGLDIPVLIGWESRGGVYRVWGGLRGGYDTFSMGALTSEPRSAEVVLSAQKIAASAIGGFAVGLGHIHVGLELSGGYVWISGDYNQRQGSLSGLTWTPATAIFWDF